MTAKSAIDPESRGIHMNVSHHSPKVILGIDPGLDGGVAIIQPDGVKVHVTPTLAAGKNGKRRYDVPGMVACSRLTVSSWP